MRIAIVSPVSPERSGISSYVEDLLPIFSTKVNVDLVIRNGLKTTFYSKDVRLISAKDFPRLYKEYNKVFYHIGNNSKYHDWIYEFALNMPGIVILHDFALHHLIADITLGKNKPELYFEYMKSCHGSIGEMIVEEFLTGQIEPPWEKRSLEFPLNAILVNSSNSVFVHSHFARRMIWKDNPDADVRVIPLYSPTLNLQDVELDKLKSHLKLPNEAFLIGVFGFVIPPKRIQSIIKAVSDIVNLGERSIYLIIVGEVSDTVPIDSLIMANSIKNNIRITGFVDDQTLLQYMQSVDVVVNLRNPSQGESSAIVGRALGLSKTCIVSDIAAYSELPNDVVIKISTGENEVSVLTDTLKKLYLDKEFSMRYSLAAGVYANNELHPEKIVEQYLEISYEDTQRIKLRKNVTKSLAMEVAKIGLVSSVTDNLIKSLAIELDKMF